MPVSDNKKRMNTDREQNTKFSLGSENMNEMDEIHDAGDSTPMLMGQGED
jgi:hypothetical protein